MEANRTIKKIFNQRIDIYGQALAIYVFVFAVFAVIYGTIDDGEFRIVFSPLLVIMSVIVFIGSFILLLAAIKRKQIIIENDTITIKNRFKSVVFTVNDIEKLQINKSPSGMVKEDASFVWIKLKGKKKSMLVRVASFNDYKELFAEFNRLKLKVNHIIS